MSEVSETGQGCGQRCGCTQRANGSRCPERESDGPSALYAECRRTGSDSQNGKVRKLGEGGNNAEGYRRQKEGRERRSSHPVNAGLRLDSILL